MDISAVDDSHVCGTLAEGSPAGAGPGGSARESCSASPWAGASGDCPPTAGAGHARALQIELVSPPSSVARSLRLAVGEPVATITVSFEDPATHRPVAITTAMLRPDLFRIVIQATAPAAAGHADGFASAWTHTVRGWEP